MGSFKIKHGACSLVAFGFVTKFPRFIFFLLKVDRLDEVWVICSEAGSVSKTSEDFKVRVIASEISNGISRENVKFENS